MIKIDYDKCIGCLSCTDKCVCASIGIEEGRPVYNEEMGCIKCMHCAIACPENAITFDGKPAVFSEELPVMSDTLADDLESLVLTRRSYRNFREEMVDPAEIRHALKFTAWAPSSSNSHMIKFITVNGREHVEKIMEIILEHIRKTGQYASLLPRFEKGMNPVVTNAPNLILAYAANDVWHPDTDAAIALTTAELLLQSRGIGTCWAGYLRTFMNAVPELQAYVGLPENCTFCGCLLAGYPTEEYHYIPERVVRPEIREIK